MFWCHGKLLKKKTLDKLLAHIPNTCGYGSANYELMLSLIMAMFGCHLCTSGAGLALLCYCHSCDLFKPVEQHDLLLHVSQTVSEVV